MTLTTDGIDVTPIDWVLDVLWDRGGTDLLVTAGSPMRIRVDSVLAPLDGSAILNEEQASAMVVRVIGGDLTEQLRSRKEVDFSFPWREQARFRGNAFHQQGGYAMSLRMIPNRIPSFEELNLPDAIERLANLPQGLVLVTGPTGSGKSTTLASMIDYINVNRPCHILTIEDPIEYVHTHKCAAVNQREVGVDTDSFASALRSALREDPDVILVGEMRDLETIQFALTIAETGHLVFATLHTNDAAQALDRISDVFPASRQEQIKVQLAASIQGVVSQRLIPKVGGGQVAAFEILIATNAMRNLIREGKTHQIRNVVATGIKDGMRTLEASLSDLVAEGTITMDDALARALFPKEIRRPHEHRAWMERQMERDPREAYVALPR
jgi:twitching motility protein PilT